MRPKRPGSEQPAQRKSSAVKLAHRAAIRLALSRAMAEKREVSEELESAFKAFQAAQEEVGCGLSFHIPRNDM